MANEKRVTLAPLVPEADIVSAIVARLVSEHEAAHEWERISDEDVTVCGRLGSTGRLA